MSWGNPTRPNQYHTPLRDSCRKCGCHLVSPESRARGVCGSCDVKRATWRSAKAKMMLER
jgi:hypothetical protein